MVHEKFIKHKKFIFVAFGFIFVVLLFGRNHLRRKYILYRNFHDSMLPEITVGETLLFKRISVKESSSFHRGQVVVFCKNFESEKNHSKNTLMLKQLVALPGDRVDFPGKVVITSPNNHAKYELSSTHLEIAGGRMLEPFEFIKQNPSGILLDKDEFFVLGTNPNKSLDSRTFGPIKREQIVGVAVKDMPMNGKQTGK